jgi:hypothetical protein
MKQAPVASAVQSGRRRLGSISPNEFGALSSRHGDDTNRRTFQPCYYRRAHAGGGITASVKVKETPEQIANVKLLRGKEQK